MKMLRTSVPALACLLMLGAGAASAAKDDESRAMPGYHGQTGMMGPGHGAMMGHGHGSMGCGPGGMMGYGHGHGSMMGHGHGQDYGSMMGHGHAHAYGHGSMMGHGHAHAHAYGHGSMMGRGNSGSQGAAGMDPGQLSDDVLDRMGERIAQRHRTMQEIASEQDPEARRELLREHLKSKQAKRHGQGKGMMDQGRGMMGQGMMGQGQGMMGQSMMSLDKLSDEQLDEIAERMAENHQRMQRLAGTTDKAERRELLREHFESMQESMGGMHRRR